MQTTTKSQTTKLTTEPTTTEAQITTEPLVTTEQLDPFEPPTSTEPPTEQPTNQTATAATNMAPPFTMKATTPSSYVCSTSIHTLPPMETSTMPEKSLQTIPATAMKKPIAKYYRVTG